MTTLDIFTKSMVLIDEVSGGTINVTDTDYLVKAPHLITILQAKLMPYGDLYKTHEISKKPINPLMGFFDYGTHNSEDVSKVVSGSAKSYYVETKGPATIYIEDSIDGSNWNILDTLEVADTVTSFTAYKDSVTPTEGAIKSRIRFSGDYYYEYCNYALFNQKFHTVPDYRPYVKYQMPTDFSSVDQIVEEYSPSIMNRKPDYYWEGKKDLYISYNFDGNIRVVYKPIPTPITAINETTNLEIDDITLLECLTYGLASLLIINENSDLSQELWRKYEDGLREAQQPKQATINGIQDLYDCELN